MWTLWRKKTVFVIILTIVTITMAESFVPTKIRLPSKGIIFTTTTTRRPLSSSSTCRQRIINDNYTVRRASKQNEDDIDDSDIVDDDNDDDDEEVLDPRFIQRNQYWVVLVDDEEAIRQAVGDYLYDEGYQITACADAAALLELLSSSSSSSGSAGATTTKRLPDAIISDIRMPTTNGIELLTQLRQHALWSRLPVILLTAKGLTADRVAGYRAGADAYLTKPFDPAELLSLLDNLILRRQQVLQQANGGTAAGLVELQQELAVVQEMMQANTQRVVQSTTVFLTAVERAVLEGVAAGYSNAEIATQCNLSPNRVTQTLSRLYQVTKCSTRTELVRWAFATGYASPHA